MTLFLGPEARERFRRIMSGSRANPPLFPTVCMASTPPVQPSLLFTIRNQSAGQELPLTLSVTWNRYDTFAIPPEQIIVSVFSVPDGSRLGSFPHPKNRTNLPISRYLRIPHIDRRGGFSAGHIHAYCRGPALGSNKPPDDFHPHSSPGE